MFVTEVVQLNFNGLRKLPILSGLGRCSANLTIFNIICWVDCLISQASDVPSFDCPRSKPATHLDTCVTLQPSISYILTIFNIIYWVNGLLEQSSHRPSVWRSNYYYFSLIFFCVFFLQNCFHFFNRCIFFCMKKIKIKSFKSSKSKLGSTVFSQFIRIILVPSDNGTMRQSTQQSTILYWRLSDFKATWYLHAIHHIEQVQALKW